jgi:error-prone DNA polymerase
MLTAIRKSFTLVDQSGATDLFGNKDANDQLAAVPAEDPAVYDMICQADTIGVFQIESRAQMTMLPRLRPRCFYDLVIEVAIIRPGPIQGGMIHPFLRRRSGQEPENYPNEAIKEVLAKTLGVPIFQEQVMRLAVVAAGFSPGEADHLRRSMASWRWGSGKLERFRTRLIEGMLANGLSREFAEQVFNQIHGFAEYGFPESHAASFALLVYVSSWLKRYHPAAFTAALLNSQPMGFYAPAQLVRDAQNHGVKVLPVDVNHSEYDCTLDNGALRLGMRLVKGTSAGNVAGITQARREKPFSSIAQLARRTGAARGLLARLASADAFRSLGLDRRQAVWAVLGLDDELPLFSGLDIPEPCPPLPPLKLSENVVHDYESVGLSLRAHPLSLIRSDLDRANLMTARQLKSKPHGQWVKVAGLVLVRQRPVTASGVVFMTLEDETGMANLMIGPTIYERFRPVARGSVALAASGPIERQGEVIHLRVRRLETISSLLSSLPATSRDFR